MPRQIFKIDQFHGGLNNNSDPRDIADNELSAAVDIMVDEVGKIVMMGGTTAHVSSVNGLTGYSGGIVPGHGLFFFSHDRTGGEDAGDEEGQSGDDYLALYDAADGQVWIYSKSEATWDDDRLVAEAGVIDIGSSNTTSARINYYVADGELRVADGTHTSTNVTQWYGYIYRIFFGDGDGSGYVGSGHSTGGTIFDKWRAADSTLTALPINSVFGVEGLTLGTAVTTTDARPVSIVLRVDEDTYADFFVNSSGNTTDATVTTLSQYVFANFTSSSTLTVIASTNDDEVGWDEMFSPGDKVLIKGSDYNKGRIFTIDSITTNPDVLTFKESTVVTGASNESIYLYNLSKIGGWTTNGEGWEFGMTTLYDDSKQESVISLYELTGTHTAADHGTNLTDINAAFGATTLVGFIAKNLTSGSQCVIESNTTTAFVTRKLTGGTRTTWVTGDKYSISILSPAALTYLIAVPIALRFEVHVFAGDAVNDGLSFVNPRVSGFNIYARRENSTNWYLQANVDVEKGVKYADDGLYSMWSAGVHTFNNFTFVESPYVRLKAKTDPIQITQYVEEDSVTVEGYKAGVVANRMAYIGNVKQDGIVYGDRVLKSSVGQFDRFPASRKIEATINDGDRIITLEAYADRLLIFKKDKMELLNISQEVEFLEDIFRHKGVTHLSATCKTDFGIAWVNKKGCYLYDGQKVHNLLEKGGRQIIKESIWDGEFLDGNDEPMIGYNSNKRQLIIVDDSSSRGDGCIFLYDMVTKSWVRGAALTFPDVKKTNFITDWDGNLVWSHTEGTGTMNQWDNSSDASSALSLKTKDIDFGHPGLKKNIYKVYISYKGDGSSTTVKYGVNGETDASDLYSFDSANLENKSSTENRESWHVATLVPGTASQAKNIYSFQIILGGTAGANFAINDMSIVYRVKGVR